MFDKNTATNPVPSIPYGGNLPVLYNPWLICEQDDTYTFHKNGTLVITHHGIVCDEESKASTTLQFTLDPETHELIIDGIKYTLNEVSSKQMKYSAHISMQTGYSSLVFILK